MSRARRRAGRRFLRVERALQRSVSPPLRVLAPPARRVTRLLIEQHRGVWNRLEDNPARRSSEISSFAAGS